MGLAIAGGQWLIEVLCFYFTFVLADSLCFVMPAIAKPRNVTGKALRTDNCELFNILGDFSMNQGSKHHRNLMLVI
ncbi:MAG: hypothetical protein KA802_14980 [Saprospiraceae bacterium]|nr:hypothetical protein [Saprospiraceae bacterium]